ncbi:hypothetical protein EV702DRAFT_1181089 [Suillus placidus]|uniref:Uncharacterized protein n=1 Tax=Suillus placidus TaxID=48579 RepID=A0A9P6ZNH1_9AGAM|nr:hypothetical protein EV702DRAFT_1181089 [Suillus placidus]
MGPERSKYCNLCDQDIKPRGWTTHRKACEMKAAKRQWDQVVVDAIHKEKVPTFNQDDIKIEYHPSSGIEAKVYGFDSFERRSAEFLVPPSDGQPWRPFKSRLEFEIAEIMLEVGFNNQQSDRFIKLCHRCTVGKEKFTFKNHKDIHNMWEAASHRITKFTKEVISIPFAGDEELREYDVHYRDLWELAADMLRNPCLFPYFMFDAHRLSKFDGNTFVSFVDEPFTARDIWDVQSQLPPGAKPLAYILYADKTKLSSFGTAKDYPVYARAGGGYVVGWLPIVKDEKLHSGKPSWVDFKNTVWHKSFARIISSLASKSQTGQWFECLDGVKRWFFLCILILSADFEEQSVMSLTRGIMSLWPCPVCLVPRDDLWDTSKLYRQRTSKDSQAVINAARAKETFEEREELLKEQALRLIDNAFWVVAFTCVFENFPCWQNLKHPNQVVGVTFTDSSVHEDISKMIIYATHDILTKNDCPLGYLLLRCVRLYLEMDMYAALEVHTTNTIEEGRHTVQAFTALMKQYMTQTADDNVKNWNFPKLHMTTHIFDDIEAKGASRNYNTKPNEQMHGPLKDWYLNRTNFKNVAEQILRIDHWLLVADDIDCCISDFDEYSQRKSDGVDDDSLDDDEGTDVGVDSMGTLDPSQHVRMGSRQTVQTFCSIENAHKTEVEFTNFRIKLNAFLNVFLPACNIPLPNGRRIHLQSDDTVTEYRFLRVNYESLVDWKQYTDYLRCNPRFFNAPRFDWVFIRTQNGVILGHLVFLFQCAIGNDFRAQPRTKAEFFSVRSIICGALLVQDSGGNPLDYFVVDTMDTDMFLRVREMHQQAGHPVRI